MKIKKSAGEITTDVVIRVLLCIAMLITLYPFIYVLSMSISDPKAVLAQEIWLFPKGFSLRAYGMVFENPGVGQAYYNTLWYTIVGTAINVLMTVIGAYPLSRKEFFARGFFMIFIAITMFFSGGLVPLFILINKLGIYNTRWAMVLPGAVSAWNLIIARVYFQTAIPDSLPESAKIDGCNDIGILFKIVLPLSMPIIAVIGLFCAVGFWNSYFPALLYLPDVKLQPITVLLQRILIQNDTARTIGVMSEGQVARLMYGMQLKYAIIIVTILPIICVYPFLQKYFVKGVMIGAIKE